MVLVFGTICLDRMRRLPQMPEIGGYVEVTSEDLVLGGEAANTANALHAWGVRVLLAGNAIGSDEFGQTLAAEIRKRCLPTFEGHHRGPCRTPVCDIFVSDDGERTMIGQGFSAMKETVDPARLPYRTGEWFTAEPNLGDAAREAVRSAQAHAMKCYTMDFVEPGDPIGPGDFWQSSTDWIGKRGDSNGNMRLAADLANQNGCFAILTDGPRGFVAAAPGSTPKQFRPYPIDRLVDGTGAGDLFRAGMLYGLSNGWETEQCLEFGSVAGALICRQMGATTAVPSLAEIKDVLHNRHSSRISL